MFLEGIDVRDDKYKRVEVESGYIKSIEILDEKLLQNKLTNEVSTKESTTNYLSIGFTDMQVNGYLGIDYSGESLTAEDISRLNMSLIKTGTLHHVPTIITNSRERIVENLKIIAKAVKKDELLKASIVGIHVEGPFISEKDGPRGAHDPLYVRDPNVEEVKEWIDAAEGLLKIVTIAPEKKGAVEFTEEVSKLGINVAIGHCEPTDQELDAVVNAGARLSTHLGNGSSAFLPRLKNHIWKQLADDRLTAGIISDGFHLPNSVLLADYRTKGIDKLVLVSDVALLGGLQPGLSKWGNIEVEICADGHLALPGTTLLAGAGHLLDWDLKVFRKATGCTLKEAIQCVTDNPSKVLGYTPAKIEVGAKADIIQFEEGKDRYLLKAWALEEGRS